MRRILYRCPTMNEIHLSFFHWSQNANGYGQMKGQTDGNPGGPTEGQCGS